MAHLPPTVQCILFLRFGIVYATQLFDNLTFVTSVSCFYKNMQQLSWNRLWVSLLALLETLPIYSISFKEFDVVTCEVSSVPEMWCWSPCCLVSRSQVPTNCILRARCAAWMPASHHLPEDVSNARSSSIFHDNR